MNYLEPIVKISGDTALSGKYIPYAKNKCRELINNGDTIRVFNTAILDKDSKNNTINVLITIRISEPYSFIYIQSTSQKTTLTSGLSRTEINYPNFNNGENDFIYFYPYGDGNTFSPQSLLYKDSKIPLITNDLNYQLTSFNNNVAQQHYLFGSQFTGEMRQIVQEMLATTVNIGYRPYYNNTDGIYTDTKGNKHLINISSKGVYTKSLTYNTFKSSIISVSIPDGVAIDYTSDTKLLDLTSIYQLSYFDYFQGWAFNSDGSQIQNVFIANQSGNFPYQTRRYKITISDNGLGVLSAVLTLVESGTFIYLSNDGFLNAVTSNSDFAYQPESMSVASYDMAKNGSYVQFYLSGVNTLKQLTSNQEYKAPLSVFYDDQGNEQVIYYYVKLIPKVMSINSDNPNVNQLSDFFYSNMASDYEGWVKNIGTLTISNDTSLSNSGSDVFNAQLEHGIIINNDISGLSIDNLGDINSIYSAKLSGTNTNDIDKLAYDIKNNNLSVDLRDYSDFNISIYTSDGDNKIGSLNSSIDTYKSLFLDTSKLIPGFKPNSYIIDLQMLNINKYLSNIDVSTIKLNRINTVSSLKDISYITSLKAQDIIFPPFLYALDNNIKTRFDYFINNQSDYNSALDSAQTILTNIRSQYSSSLRTYFQTLINYLKSYQDPSQLDYNHINVLINNINTNYVPIINALIDSINAKIDSFNTLITSGIITEYWNEVNDYMNLVNSFIEQYGDSNCNDLGMTFKNLATITTAVSSGKETHTTYYSANQLSQCNFKVSQNINNRKIFNNTYIFNYLDRQSFAYYTQERDFESLNYYVYSTFNNKTMHFDTCKTNEMIFYKQDNIYDTSSGTITTYGDLTPINSLSYNKISMTITDYQNNSQIISDYVINDSSAPIQKMYNNTFTSSEYPIIQYHKGVLGDTISNAEYNTVNNYSYRDINYTSILLDYVATFKKSLYINSNNSNKIDLTISNINDNDRRFIIENSDNNKDINFQLYTRTNILKNDGTIFFNWMKDAFTYNYVVGKDIYTYIDTQYFLTNITLYPNINYNNNVYPVNFIGLPFYGV